jgi:predicted aspartyl protease
MHGPEGREDAVAAPCRRWPAAAATPANTALLLGSVAILGTLLWAMHEDAQHALRREAMEQQARAPQPSAEQRRHVAAQFVCGHGVAYHWVNANTVECLRELGPQVALGR